MFFLPVRVLSRVFRGKFLHHLKQAYHQGRLGFHGRLSELADSTLFERYLDTTVRQDWVVYAKRPFGGPRQVVRYLARYTHRVAISNRRLIDAGDGRVRFHWKDYADNGVNKVMTLDTVEFLRRFLMHTLPRGFPRIRYYGLLANRRRSSNLQRCRQILGEAGHNVDCRTTATDATAIGIDPDGKSVHCPECRTGTLVIIECVPRPDRHPLRGPHFLWRLNSRASWDTS